MQLMLKNTPVLSFDLESSTYKVEDLSLMPYSLRNASFNPDEAASLTEYAEAIQRRDRDMMGFLSRRILPANRTFAPEIFKAFSYVQYYSDEDRAQIAMDSGAFSCSDSYWIKNDDEDMTWTRFNPRKKFAKEKVVRIALLGESYELGSIKRSPELTTGGTFAKAWVKSGEGLYLFKRSGSRRESEVEVEVSALLDCLPILHVGYEKVRVGGEVMCKCKCLADEERSIVSAEEVFLYFRRDMDKFFEWAFQLDMDAIYKMCIVDYLISNPDRTMDNWGFYQNNTTGFLTGCHPLFDHNRAFDPDLMKLEDGGESALFPNRSQKEVAEFAMTKCNMYYLHNPRRDFFFDPEHYESFMHRAESLGIILR